MRNRKRLILLSLYFVALALFMLELSCNIDFNQNAVLHLNNGLHYIHKAHLTIDSYEVQSNYVDSAITHFKKAYTIEPNDDYTRYCYASSLFSKGKFEQSDSIIGKEWINVESAFLQSRIAFKKGDRACQKQILINCIYNQPDIIESPFFLHIFDTDSTIAQEAITESMMRLKEEYNNNHDILIKSRLAKVMYSIGETQCAKVLLLETTSAMPNMNRPWFYLACIYANKGDIELAKRYVKISMFLDGRDPLPHELNNMLNQKETNKKWRWTHTSHLAIEQAYNRHIKEDTELIIGLDNYMHPCLEGMINSNIFKR